MSKELLLVVEAVANEKEIEREIIFEALEEALALATRKKNNINWDVRVEIDRKTGDYETYRCWTVVADDADLEEMEVAEEAIVRLSDAQQDAKDVELGAVLAESIPSVDFGRIAAQTAKQVIVQKVREAERERMIQKFEKRIGTLVSGQVKRVTREAIYVDLGDNAEGYLSRERIIPREAYRIGDRVRAFLEEVDRDQRGPRLMLSRTAPGMIMELFKLEVPEIAEELIEIKSAARDPGSRAKIAVHTNDKRIDPVGACVGMRGSRVQSISNELGGERVDIILWDPNDAQFAISAMSPAEVVSIVMDEDNHSMDIAVQEDTLSQAIGRGGQNVRLASELTGWKLNVVADSEAEQKQLAEAQETLQEFMTSLDVEQDVAQALVETGFSSLEELAYVPKEEFLSVGVFDEETIDELQARANNALLTKALSGNSVTPAEDLLTMESMTPEIANQLAAQGIGTMEDLAEQAVDDLLEIEGIDEKRAAELIMIARRPWFDGEQA